MRTTTVATIAKHSAYAYVVDQLFGKTQVICVLPCLVEGLVI